MNLVLEPDPRRVRNRADLKKSGGTAAMTVGVPLPAIAAVLGHADPSPTAIDTVAIREAQESMGSNRSNVRAGPGTSYEAFKLHDGKWQLIAAVEDDDPVRIAPFEAVTFSLAELWD